MDAPTPALVLKPTVLEVLGRGVALVVGTADTGLQPELCRAWGPRWDAAAGQLDVLVPLPAGDRALSNLRAAPKVAFTFTMPTDYTAFQLKGRAIEQRDPDAADWRRARDHFDAFLAQVPRVGLDPAAYAAWFPARGRLLRAQIAQVFDQAPGPRAGLSL